jgi:hypothetical protein
MTTSASEIPRRSERLRGYLPRLSLKQIAIEQKAMRFRADRGISEFVELPLEVAKLAIPGCEIFGLRHVPNITLQLLIHARTVAYGTFGALARRDGDTVQIVFNDAHQAQLIRVNVMEEIFHVLLGHCPSIVCTVAREGRYRTHDWVCEEEAEACAQAALVPFAGLKAMLERRTHIARIAEHFFVPVDVVQERIGATNLGDLMNAQIRQFSLLPG